MPCDRKNNNITKVWTRVGCKHCKVMFGQEASSLNDFTFSSLNYTKLWCFWLYVTTYIQIMKDNRFFASEGYAVRVRVRARDTREILKKIGGRHHKVRNAPTRFTWHCISPRNPQHKTVNITRKGTYCKPDEKTT